MPDGFRCPLFDLTPEGVVPTMTRVEANVGNLTDAVRDVKGMLQNDRESALRDAGKTRDVAYRARNLSWKAILIAGAALSVAVASITFLITHLGK